MAQSCITYENACLHAFRDFTEWVVQLRFWFPFRKTIDYLGPPTTDYKADRHTSKQARTTVSGSLHHKRRVLRRRTVAMPPSAADGLDSVRVTLLQQVASMEKNLVDLCSAQAEMAKELRTLLTAAQQDGRISVGCKGWV